MSPTEMNIAGWLPYALVGLLVVIGATTIAIAGLPWQTRREADLREELWHTKLSALVETQIATNLLCKENAAQITELTKNLAVLAVETRFPGGQR